MKELLKISEVKDAICASEIHVDNEAELDKMGAGLLSLMDKSESFATMIVNVAHLFITRRKELTIVAEVAKRSADVKLKN